MGLLVRFSLQAYFIMHHFIILNKPTIIKMTAAFLVALLGIKDLLIEVLYY